MTPKQALSAVLLYCQLLYERAAASDGTVPPDRMMTSATIVAVVGILFILICVIALIVMAL